MAGFRRFAQTTSRWAGNPIAFGIAATMVLVWAVSGPMFDYSAEWQLVINTGTTIVTFLMVFLIQNAQNRDTEAIQIKLDELIRAVKDADNAMMDLGRMEEAELEALREYYERLGRDAGCALEKRRGHERK
ncbi:low affinity iron permease family protein [Thermomonas sp. XSG]|uniref:low affinity iron permease family protein n=1 Tax=Thermomonas sp. XSG TaxID=2771436 RepID=UPI00086E3E7E|nr:low affinity iron permease family protein [Thermomonas sp. XSG]ODU51925.1 MAG: hypothetical protein ABS98_05385 [Xanthomonadaceae bacterium SCN 69-48]